MSADSEYVDHLRSQYLPLLNEHGTTHRAVNWGSARGQQRRFEILMEALTKSPASILDVGCGVGELAAFLESRGYCGAYEGVDLLPEMIETAQRRFPQHRFTQSIVDAPFNGVWELIVASGIMAYCTFEQLKAMARSMYDACTVAVAFNVLSTWGPNQDDGDVYHDPLETLAECRKITPWVTLRHDYMPHDFTIYMYREQH